VSSHKPAIGKELWVRHHLRKQIQFKDVDPKTSEVKNKSFLATVMEIKP